MTYVEIIIVEKIKTLVLYLVTFYPPENRDLYETMSKNLVVPERRRTVWLMRFACWIVKAACAQAQTRARALTFTPTQTHARTHMHALTHTEICSIYCFLRETVVS